MHDTQDNTNTQDNTSETQTLDSSTSQSKLHKILPFFIAFMLIIAVALLTVRRPGSSAFMVTTAYGVGDTGPIATPTLRVGDTEPSPTLTVTPTGVGSTQPTSTPTLNPIPTNTPTITPSPTSVPTATPTVDRIPPVVHITTPLNNSIVVRGSLVDIKASVTDNDRVGRIDFYVNSVLRCTSLATQSAFSCRWSVPNKPNVKYQIKATAYDYIGNNSSDIISVTSK